MKHKRLSVKCSQGVNKAWPLGHAQYTLSGNLGPLFPHVYDAKNNGYNDIMWLLDDYVQDLTIHNLFFIFKTRYNHLVCVTPLDNGCILPNSIR